MAKFSFSLGGNVLVALLLVAALLGAAFLFYRYTLPPLAPLRRTLLSVIRSLALVLMLLIFFEPVLRLVQTDHQPAGLAVLIDNSQSMTIPTARNPASDIRPLINNSELSHLPSGAGMKLHLFASKLQPEQSALPESLRFDGETTDLSAVLAGLKDRIEKENIRGVVLISDGNYTNGRNPVYDAEALGVPLFTVGVGDTAKQKDILVAKAVSNAIAYAETRVPVDISIKSSGYADQNVEVTLSEGPSLLDRTVLKVKEGTHEYPLRMFVEPKEEGTKKYTVSVSRLPGELTEKNNARSFFVKVLRSKLRILLFAGAPAPDVAAVRQAFTEDGHFTVASYVQKSRDVFYEGPFRRQLLDSADCLVLVGFPSQGSSPAILQQVAEAVDREKKPVFFINSRKTDYAKLQQLEPALPFSWSGVSQNEGLIGAAVPALHRNHPLATLQGTMTDETWQRLPPIFKTQTIFRAKPGSDILASGTFQNTVIGEPLILSRNLNGEKSYAITGEGVWRWRLLVQDDTRLVNFFPVLMGNVVRWLTTREDQKRVRIAPLKEVFTTAEQVEMEGQIYDEQLRPEDDAEVTVDLEHGKEKTKISLNAVGNGRYEGSLDGLPGGDYTFTGKATAGGTAVGEDRGKFTVGQVNLEFLQTRMNKQLLEQMAFQTGGRYVDIDSAAGLFRDIASAVKFEPKELVNASEIELWNWKYLAGLIILLLAVEWFLRKRSGML
jgi:hypothetical protein